MNMQAREKLKDEAEAILFDESSTPAMKAQAHLMRIEAYHARELETLKKKAPSFDLYGSNYLAANCAEIDSESFTILERRFPACTKRMIETGFSHWNSYGKQERYFYLLGRRTRA
jgi:peptidyl-tRNA hydrolase